MSFVHYLMLMISSIIAAVLNKYYSFTNPFGTEWTIWYLRESYTALLCANLPLIYPLIQRVFKLRNWGSGAYETSNQYRLNSNPTRPRLVQHTWERQNVFGPDFFEDILEANTFSSSWGEGWNVVW